MNRAEWNMNNAHSPKKSAARYGSALKLGRATCLIVSEHTDHQANNGTRGDRGQDGIRLSIIIDPMIPLRGIVKAISAIVSDIMGAGVVVVISADTVARRVAIAGIVAV